MDDGQEEVIWSDVPDDGGEAETGQADGAEVSTGDAGIDAGEDTGGDDAPGDSAYSGLTSAASPEDDEQLGDTEGVTDYVTSQQADEIISQFEAVNTKVDILVASSVVLVIALLAVVGCLAVETLVRSFEDKR